jgi:hypothetical protein
MRYDLSAYEALPQKCAERFFSHHFLFDYRAVRIYKKNFVGISSKSGTIKCHIIGYNKFQAFLAALP